MSDFLFLLDGRQAVRLSVAHFDEFGVLQFVAALGAQQPRRVKQRHQRQRCKKTRATRMNEVARESMNHTLRTVSLGFRLTVLDLVVF